MNDPYWDTPPPSPGEQLPRWLRTLQDAATITVMLLAIAVSGAITAARRSVKRRTR